jgi:S-DNA-T family DNA segregation ATPase FtsK/SpoIIIE
MNLNLQQIKASRIIGLADNIARSLYAISTRIANIPGRSVLGIKIPNEKKKIE